MFKNAVQDSRFKLEQVPRNSVLVCLIAFAKFLTPVFTFWATYRQSFKTYPLPPKRNFMPLTFPLSIWDVLLASYTFYNYIYPVADIKILSCTALKSKLIGCNSNSPPLNPSSISLVITYSPIANPRSKGESIWANKPQESNGDLESTTDIALHELLQQIDENFVKQASTVKCIDMIQMNHLSASTKPNAKQTLFLNWELFCS